jgi:hypothetical protein
MKLSDKVEFIVRGKIGETDITPDNISLTLLNNFTKDITDLLNSIQETKKEDIVVSIEKSSFKIKSFIALAALNIIKADIETLNSTKDLATINEKRSNIFEDWAKKTKANYGLEFEINLNGSEGLKINSNSEYKRSDANIWVESEVFLYGIVTDLGGAQRPNIHMKTEDGKSITIDCTKNDLVNEKENRVYQPVAIRAIANQNLYTGELKEIRFSSFVDYKPVYNEKELLATIEKGRNAWSAIENHVEWVRNLRLDNE